MCKRSKQEARSTVCGKGTGIPPLLGPVLVARVVPARARYQRLIWLEGCLGDQSQAAIAPTLSYPVYLSSRTTASTVATRSFRHVSLALCLGRGCRGPQRPPCTVGTAPARPDHLDRDGYPDTRPRVLRRYIVSRIPLRRHPERRPFAQASRMLRPQSVSSVSSPQSASTR